MKRVEARQRLRARTLTGRARRAARPSPAIRPPLGSPGGRRRRGRARCSARSRARNRPVRTIACRARRHDAGRRQRAPARPPGLRGSRLLQVLEHPVSRAAAGCFHLRLAQVIGGSDRCKRPHRWRAVVQRLPAVGFRRAPKALPTEHPVQMRVRGVSEIHTISIVLHTNYSQPFGYKPDPDLGCFAAANRLRAPPASAGGRRPGPGAQRGGRNHSHPARTIVERASHAGSVRKVAVRRSGPGIGKDCASGQRQRNGAALPRSSVPIRPRTVSPRSSSETEPDSVPCPRLPTFRRFGTIRTALAQ